MTIRDKFRRALGGPRLSSESSSSAAASVFSSSSPTPSTSTSTSAPDSPTRLSVRIKTFSWGRSRGGRTSEKKSPTTRSPSPDPREKPFTETNLQYQAMFDSFTMTFGATRRLSVDEEPISPCTSRRTSMAV